MADSTTLFWTPHAPHYIIHQVSPDIYYDGDGAGGGDTEMIFGKFTSQGER